MKMLGWFKKNKCRVNHFKKFGEPWPKEMETIIGFTEYKNTPIDCYKIVECKNCGKRAYAGCGHCMGDYTASIIDYFIKYKIEIDTLIKEFERRKYRYEIKK